MRLRRDTGDCPSSTSMKCLRPLALLATMAVILPLGSGVTASRYLSDRSSNPNLQLPSNPPGASAIRHGLRTKKKVALTFDACSTRQPSHYDENVTRVLVATNTPATIFLGGKWVEDEKEQARYLASLPTIEIGNHTYDHPHLTLLSDERIRDEIEHAQKALLETTGRRATLFRPPYGEYDDRVVRIAARMGLVTIEYDLASGDPDKHATKDKLVEYVTSMARNGSIIVMHINRRGWHTAEALPEIIAILRKRGFKLVTVGELLADLKKAGTQTKGETNILE